MARNRTTPIVSTTVTMDAVDFLVEKLNQIEGISFVRDAWEDKAPDDYGVVELTGQNNALYADNHMIEQTFTLAVHLYAVDGSNAWIGKIQEKLNEATDGFSLPVHEYAWDIQRNHWQWTAYLIGPLQWDEVVTGG